MWKRVVAFVACSMLLAPVASAAKRRTHEVRLSARLMRKLQSNLVDGGYLHGTPGTINGRLSARTRRALIDFQREYHLRPTGRIDRTTADALLGRDVITSYLASR